ncbi:alginate lyase family protein [Chromohalobacter canadensis]|uniref:Alginate lyase family protein n=1 Tax=Chromohalobacter canadensis TaxID=141389 RepID=A0A285VJS0_9GAMM|nr:alginate lyase family protein [Chromohalobacter canadensis]MCK0767850.1 alginate lyase family protein [Chromohalobacter canadensis]WQH08420.1 alginate lyase family protein [Chromohalobacter canadensis]SOC54364.1 poly(beta-D-mannuronate) lyase [Chromohalobacter canadensis]
MSTINDTDRNAGMRQCAGLLLVVFLTMGLALPALAMSIEERQKLDLSEYQVTETNASYFDVEARMTQLQHTENPLLLAQVDALATGPSCKQLLQVPPLDTKIRIPGFYPNPKEWREISGPLFQFEKTVANLAGAYVASGDIYYGKCLIRFLDKWAQHDALTQFYYDQAHPQAWFSTESMIFSAATAYSVVRGDVDGMDDSKQRVNDWLRRLAYKHKAIPGQPNNSCCNNHFYRRALYASMIGVLTEDDELFRFGVSAVYSALHDLTKEGAFRLEMKRGRRASHYQNYALLYLIPNMQIISRQGYDIFDKEIDGYTIEDAVDFAIDIFEDPSALGDMAPHEQYKEFLKDDQYLAWMEIYLSHVDNPRLAQFLKTMRPITNRGAGGYVTLYFMDPDAQQQAYTESQKQRSQVFEGLQ